MFEWRSVPFVAYGRRLARLPRGQLRTTIEALALVASVSRAFAILPPSGVALVLSHVLGTEKLRPPPAASAAEIAQCVRRASRYVPHTNCLSQAVAGWLMLRRRAYGSDLKLGARREDLRVGAHAWLEVDGKILLGASEAPSHVTLS